MCKQKGFSLVELLVVIAIIALLMAVLMPALNLAKRQAKSAACKVTLHQWSLIWSLYCEDNDDKFCGAQGAGGWLRGTWIVALRDKWRTRTDILRCPMAVKIPPWRGTSDKYDYGGPFHTYQMGKGGIGGPGEQEEECSFAANDWIYDTTTDIQGRPKQYHWMTPNVAGGHNVPVFADAMWRGGGPWYKNNDPRHNAINPPDFNGQWVPHTYGGEMRHFCIDRHSGTVNHIFMDWSVRSVGLKELWTLKWHRQFNTGDYWTKGSGIRANDWPKWMQQLKDY